MVTDFVIVKGIVTGALMQVMLPYSRVLVSAQLNVWHGDAKEHELPSTPEPETSHQTGREPEHLREPR
jgi:hypothetical protein